MIPIRSRRSCVALLAACGLALLPACTAVQRDAGFSDVSRVAIERTGKDIHWLRGGPEDAAVAKRVHEMLSRELTVEDAVQVALLNNRGLQATYEDLGVAQANLVQAGLLSNPVLSGQIKPALSGPGPEIELSLTQNFLELLYIPMREKVAAAKLDEAKQRVASEVLDLAARVRVQFLRAQGDAQLVELRRQVVQSTDASATLARRMHEAGNITDAMLDAEHLLHEQAQLDLADAATAAALSRERLSEIMGVDGDHPAWSIAAHLPDLPKEEIDAAGAEQKAVDRSLDVAAARLRVESSAKVAGLTKASALVPDLSAGAAAKRETSGDWLLGPAFTLPIPLLDQGQARISGAQAEFRRARFEHDEALVRVRAAARSAVIQLHAAHAKAVKYRDAIVPRRHNITEETQKEYNGMLVGVLQLLDARRQEIDAGRRSVEALRDYWVARARFDSILSGRIPSNTDPVSTTANAGE
ncbi:MAG: TolC family protein [Planctomycetes bacterium]|nr:TolC family protein [Planctomycetota bacterium]